MFILSLRGKFGTRIAMLLHGLALVMTTVLFGSTAFCLQLTALLIFISGSTFILRYMNQNRECLEFNSLVNVQVAYPSSMKVEKATAYFQGAICAIFFIPLVIIRLLGISISDVPNGIIVVAFYFGVLACLGILQGVVRGST